MEIRKEVPHYYNFAYERSYPFIHIYLDIFGEYPNLISLYGMDQALLCALLNQTPCAWSRTVETLSETKTLLQDKIFVYENYIIGFDGGADGEEADITLYFPDNERPAILELVEKLRPLRKEKKISRVHLITNNNGELDLYGFTLTPPTVELALLYGEDFLPTYQYILRRLITPKDKGVALLYGPPGTGKTTLLRYLISEVSAHKDVIYLPPDLTRELASPNFLNFLMRRPESVLIIEDAENVIKARGEHNHQAVANLLNLTDGLLSDCLGIQIVCSFNCEINKIDPALLRKGRLIAKHYFDKLNVEQAQKLCDAQQIPLVVTEPMTLAEIFYHADTPPEAVTEKPRIGFQV